MRSSDSFLDGNFGCAAERAREAIRSDVARVGSSMPRADSTENLNQPRSRPAPASSLPTSPAADRLPETRRQRM